MLPDFFSETTELDLSGTELSDLTPLRELTGLRALNLAGTQVSDLTPLRDLTGLQSLNLEQTQVSDLAPLRGLTALQSLNLSGTQVSDLEPLRDLTNLQSLDLSGTKVSDLEALRDLTGLQSLDLSRTNVSDFEALRDLTGLQSLDLSGTKASDLAPLSDLTGLQSLNLSVTQVSDLEALRDLTGLQSLNLWGTKASDLEPLRGLTALQTLDISVMQVSDLAPVRDLTGLQSLDLSHTQVSDLVPMRDLTGLQSLIAEGTRVSDLAPLRDLTGLQSLNLLWTHVSDLSPLEELLVSGGLRELRVSTAVLRMQPPELAEAKDVAAAFRSYFQDLRPGARRNTDLKLVLVGNARVGKTTLKHNLVHRKPPTEPIQERTHGIDATTIAWPAGEEEFRLTMWDLAGQEIYHTMHRFLLHPRALFLLLWAEETDEVDERELHPVSYWLELVRQLGPGCVTILVKNQIDRSNRFGTRPPELLGAELPVAEEVAVSAADSRGLAALRETISEQILRFRDTWNYLLPTSWLAVRAEVEERREAGARDLPFGQFEQLCTVHDAQHPRILAEYLDRSGFLFYRAGHFADRLILDQDWLLEQVYAVFDPRRRIRQRIVRAGGRILAEDAEWVWPEHNPDERKVFLDFLISAELAFRVGWEPAEYFIPALLPAEPDFRPGTGRGDLWLELRYRVLHRALIERLIVRLSSLSPHRQWWCSGIDVRAPDRSWEASVEAKGDGRTLAVHVHLPRDQPQGSEQRLGVAAALLQLIEEALPGAEPAIAGSADGKTYVDLDELDRARAEQRPHCVDADRNVCETAGFAGVPSRADLARASRHELDVEDRTRAPEPRRLKIFISYAHEDEALKAELEKRLKAIERTYPIEPWNDRQILAGAPVHDEILKRLRAADVTLLLISTDFVASDYCWTREMEVALEQYQREGRLPVPIIVRRTPGWHESKIGQHLALPRDGRPLSAWPTPDDFWGEVEEGLRRLIRDQLGLAD